MAFDGMPIFNSAFIEPEPMNHVKDFLIREKALNFLHELEEAQFMVILVPPREQMNTGHMNRACVSQNPEWYRKFCAENVSCRGIGRKKMKRARTFIHKDRTISALRQFIDSNRRGGIQIERLIDFIWRQVKNERCRTKIQFDDFPF